MKLNETGPRKAEISGAEFPTAEEACEAIFSAYSKRERQTDRQTDRQTVFTTYWVLTEGTLISSF